MYTKIVSELVKIANVLDDMGLIKEAKNVDNVLLRIAQVPPIANDYVQDINTYKNLLLDRKLKDAEYFLKQVANSYTDQKKRDAFLGQANKIQSQNYNKIDNEANMSDDQIYNLLQKYGINNASDLTDLDTKWKSMMTELRKQKSFSENMREILEFTYRNVAAKFNYSAFGFEVTGDYKKDLDQYKMLFNNRLTNDAETFLRSIISSNKYKENQKKLFANEAEFFRTALNPEILEETGYQSLSDENINFALKKYGVLSTKNYQEFNNAFYNMINNYYMKEKFNVDENNPKAPVMYGYPAVKKQLQLVKEKIMLQKNWTKPVSV